MQSEAAVEKACNLIESLNFAVPLAAPSQAQSGFRPSYKEPYNLLDDGE
jgi:hypothetical protein